LVAKRYATLPSQVLKMGNSIDVKCALLSLEHENYLNKKANEDNGIKDTNHSTEELQAMMNNVRVQDG
jgi:hypothetical protein